VIVLDQNSIIKAQAVVAGAAHPNRVLLKNSPTRGGLPGVHHLRLVALHHLRQTPGIGGNPGKPLQEVQGDALPRQD